MSSLLNNELSDREFTFLKAYEAEINTKLEVLLVNLAEAYHVPRALQESISRESAGVNLLFFKLGQIYADTQWSE